MEEGLYMKYLVENSPKDEAWAFIQETAVVQNFLGSLSADKDLSCSEELTDYLVLVQVNGALEDEPEE